MEAREWFRSKGVHSLSRIDGSNRFWLEVRSVDFAENTATYKHDYGMGSIKIAKATRIGLNRYDIEEWLGPAHGEVKVPTQIPADHNTVMRGTNIMYAKWRDDPNRDDWTRPSIVAEKEWLEKQLGTNLTQNDMEAIATNIFTDDKRHSTRPRTKRAKKK